MHEKETVNQGLLLTLIILGCAKYSLFFQLFDIIDHIFTNNDKAE